MWVPWALWQAYGNLQVLERPVRLDDCARSPRGIFALADRAVGYRLPIRRLAGPNGPAGSACPHQSRQRCRGNCLPLPRHADIDTANLLGRSEDAEHFGDLAERTRTAFNEHYVDDDGTIHSDAATVYALAIVFGLLDEETAQLAGNRLVELVAESGYRIQTGFAGTPYVMDALSATGHLDEACRLLLQPECPSWLYPVTMGATTIWERWDSMLPDGTINPGQMTSFNHYALGAVADWMHRSIGGIAPFEPGYSKVLIAPQPGGDIRWAQSSLETRHGKISVSWSRGGDGPIEFDIAVPDGVAALVQLPGSDVQEFGSGRHHISSTHAATG